MDITLNEGLFKYIQSNCWHMEVYRPKDRILFDELANVIIWAALDSHPDMEHMNFDQWWKLVDAYRKQL